MLDTDGPASMSVFRAPDERWIGPPDRPTVSRVPVLVPRRALGGWTGRAHHDPGAHRHGRCRAVRSADGLAARTTIRVRTGMEGAAPCARRMDWPRAPRSGCAQAWKVPRRALGGWTGRAHHDPGAHRHGRCRAVRSADGLAARTTIRVRTGMEGAAPCARRMDWPRAPRSGCAQAWKVPRRALGGWTGRAHHDPGAHRHGRCRAVRSADGLAARTTIRVRTGMEGAAPCARRMDWPRAPRSGCAQAWKVPRRALGGWTGRAGIQRIGNKVRRDGSVGNAWISAWKWLGDWVLGGPGQGPPQSGQSPYMARFDLLGRWVMIGQCVPPV